MWQVSGVLLLFIIITHLNFKHLLMNMFNTLCICTQTYFV